LAACQRKRLRFLRFSFTQRTQRKRLRLNGNRALHGRYAASVTNKTRDTDKERQETDRETVNL